MLAMSDLRDLASCSMKNSTVYCIDIDSRRPQVLEFGGRELAYDLKFFGVSTPRELQTYDRRIFNTLEEAESFFERYNRTLQNLSNDRICLSRDLPAMLYKRRYMALTLLGLKPQTYRPYLKPWRPGDLVNLHDQTFFLTVRIKNIYFDESKKLYCYQFEKPTKE